LRQSQTAHSKSACHSQNHDVVAEIDEDRLAGNARARFPKAGMQRSRNLGGIDVTLQRGALYMRFEMSLKFAIPRAATS